MQKDTPMNNPTQDERMPVAKIEESRYTGERSHPRYFFDMRAAELELGHLRDYGPSGISYYLTRLPAPDKK